MPGLYGRLAIIVALAVACMATPAFAQSLQGDAGVGVGLKGGFLYSGLKFSEADDVFEARTGWMAGIFFGGNRTGPVGVMGELNILRKKTVCTDCGDTALDVYYLQVPVLLRLNLGSRSRGGVSVYGIGGPAIDLKLGEDLTSFAIINEFEGFDVSVIGGVGVELSRFIVEARGTWGLRNVAKDLAGSEKISSRTFAIQVGLRFN